MTETPSDRDPYAPPAPGETPPPPPPQSATGGYGGSAYPAYGGPYRPARNGMGVAALVLGILALLSCWTIFGGIVFGILAVVFGLIGRGRAKRGEATNGGSALGGAITGAIGLVLSIVLIIVGAVFFEHHKQDFQNLQDCLDHAQTQAQRDECNREFSNAVFGN